MLPATEATWIFILMDTINIPRYCTKNSAYISEVSAHVNARLAVLHFHSFVTGTHHVCCVSVIVDNFAASKCHHCHSIICCSDYATVLPLHVAASVSKCVYMSVPDSLIKMMGRWKRDAYLSYIRPPRQELATLSKCLTSGYP